MNLSADALHVWCAYPADYAKRDSVAYQTALSWLSTEEMTRWRSFRFDKHRNEYLATRALIRTTLSNYYEIAPETWFFPRNSYGKPSAKPIIDLQFNLSNTLGLIVCLVSRNGSVGIDTEPLSRAEEIDSVATEYFSDLELTELNSLSSQARPDRSLSLWTLKEAYIKARGYGLSIPLDKFSFLFNKTDNLQLLIDNSLNDRTENWRYGLLEFANHRIAYCASIKHHPTLTLFESRTISPPKIVSVDEYKILTAES